MTTIWNILGARRRGDRHAVEEGGGGGTSRTFPEQDKAFSSDMFFLYVCGLQYKEGPELPPLCWKTKNVQAE